VAASAAVVDLGAVSAEAAVSAVADPVAAVADSARPDTGRRDFLGAPLDLAGRSEIEQSIRDQLAKPGPGLLHIATLNPEYVVGARTSAPFAAALRRTEWSAPDGVGIVLGVRCLTGERISRVTGVELAEWLFDAPFPEPPRIFLLGNPASVAALQGRHPLRAVGRWGAGSSGPEDDSESIERIQERAADVVLVGYGAPAQVLWIERNRAALAECGVRVAIGVGGALDYLAGTAPRAPGFIRRLGLEWLYRLVREPWRWRRQLALPKFALLVVRARRDRLRES